MRGLLFFRSKLAAWLVGMTAMVAIPVVGAIAIAYTILPDIGVFSGGQKVIIWTYGILCLLAVIYAFVATWAFLDEIWRQYLPDYERMRYYTGLIILPVIGSFFMLYLFFKPSFKAGGTAKRLCGILISGTIVDIVILSIFFFEKAGLEWLLLIAGIMGIVHYTLLIITALKLAKDPVGRPAKIIITLLLVSMLGAMGFMASSRWIIDAKIAEAKEELADIYGRPLTAEALKNLYYHGLEPNYNKFEKILPRDPDDKRCFLSLPLLSEELTCCYLISLTSKKLDKKLAEWIKSEKAFFRDFDRITGSEKYLKMPESIRNYNGLLFDLALPELNHLRHWARVVRMRVRNALNNNDTAEALRLFKQLRRIRDYSTDGHCLISFLVALAIEEIRFWTLELIVGRGNLTIRQIHGLIREIEDNRLNWTERYTVAMYGNAVIDLDIMEYFAREMDLYMSFLEIRNDFLQSHLLRNDYLDENTLWSKFLITPAYIMHHKEVLYALNFLITRAKAAPNDPIIRKTLDDMPENLIFCRVVLGSFGMVWEKTKIIRNIQTAAITALRIELYRKKYKKLPEKLGDLVPEFAPEIPKDLFDGKPLKYIHGKITLLFYDARVKYSVNSGLVPIKVKGYRVYTVGFNEEDEQGFCGSIKNRYYDDIGFSVVRGVVQ